jgi:hypothetical protein
MELRIYKDVFTIERSADHYGYALNEEYKDALYMLMLGLYFRFWAYVFMILISREKQGGKSVVFEGWRMLNRLRGK